MCRKPLSILVGLALIPMGLAVGCGDMAEATDLVDSLVAGIETVADNADTQTPPAWQQARNAQFGGPQSQVAEPGNFDFQGRAGTDLGQAQQGAFGPPGDGGGEPPADPLGLTEEQRDLLRAIFEAAHDDIRGILETEREASLALLTEEQLAILEELRPPRHHHGPLPPPPGDPNAPIDPNMPPPPPPGGGGHGGPGGGGPGGPGHGGPPPGDPNAPIDPNMPPPPPRHGGGPLMALLMCVNEPPADAPERPHPLLRFADELSLTADQIAALEALHADTKVAVEARRDVACEEALVVLTEEQIAILTELDPPPPPPHGGGTGGPGGPGGGPR